MDLKLQKDLTRLAWAIRIGTLEALKARGFGHAGGALSVADALAVLYGSQMRYDPANPSWPERDKLVCSKGHAGPAVYAVLAEKGFFPTEMLKTLNQPGTSLPSHCDKSKTPGIDMTTGSLGQGTSLAVGLALGDKLKGRDNRTYLIVGDGELNEGQCWEAFMFAAGKGVDNLTVLIDRNQKQLDGPVKDVLETGDFGEKFEAFGFFTQSIPGNDVEAVYGALEAAKRVSGKPQAIVLNTVKGAGVKEIEDMAANHSVTVSTEKWAEWQDACKAVLAAL